MSEPQKESEANEKENGIEEEKATHSERTILCWILFSYLLIEYFFTVWVFSAIEQSSRMDIRLLYCKPIIHPFIVDDSI